MPLVLARRVGQQVRINDNIIMTLEGIDSDKILLDFDCPEKLNFEYPEGVERDGDKFLLNKEDTLIINKYFKVRFNKLRGQKLAHLGFDAPKNVKIKRVETEVNNGKFLDKHPL